MPDRPAVLVTGAARRLGRAIALELAAAGWDLAVHYRASGAAAAETVAQARALGADAEAFAADLADESPCDALVDRVAARFDRLQAVVNNASLFDYDSVDDFGYAAMERHWRANTGAPILLARALHRRLAGRPGARGVVVNLLDQKLWNPNPDHLSYTLSKAALATATTLLAQALAPVVRVCGVAPGLTLTSEHIAPQALAALQARTPLGHGVRPADVAHAVRAMLDNPALTGTTLIVDAGSHLSPAARDFAFQSP
jgi:NAD(P)-dependent dehydrogenase (short-subunit alcohol dehydrogenase family)